MARIEGTGLKTPSKESSKKATAFLGGFQKKADEKFIKTYERKQEGGIQNSDFETDRYNKLKQKYGDQFSSDASETFERRDFFSMKTDPRNEVKTASADIQSLSLPGSEAFNQEVDQYDRNMQKRTTSDQFGEKGTDERQKNVGDSYQIYRQFRYENDPGGYIQGQDFSKAPTKEKTIGERVADFTGNVVNTLTGTQSAVASTKEAGKGMFGGSVPEGTYSQFSPTSKPQYQTNREENRPFSSKNLDASKTPFGSVNLRASEKPTTVNTESKVGGTVVTPADTSALNVKSFANRGKVDTGDTSFSSYVRGGGEGQQRGETSTTTSESSGAPRQTVASLPSDYKQTEAKQFAKTKAYQEAKKIAKRNPNVSVGVDSKGQPTATATNDSGVARAQAAAVNRKLSGKSISQVKAANRQSMKDKAAARNETFKKTKKSTVGARRAAAKKANQAAAKKRHAAFKKKRLSKQRQKARNAARKRAQARRKSRGRRSRRRCDIFLKYNISPLTNMNLIRDDLAEVAYFVKEIQG